MIVRVMRRAEEAAVGPVVVATDSREIAGAVARRGWRAVMTRSDHSTGSDRYARRFRWPTGRQDENSRQRQGDFPMLQGADIRLALGPLADPASISRPLRSKSRMMPSAPTERRESGLLSGGARPLSRALFHPRDRADRRGPLYHHIGLYAYRRARSSAS